METTEQGTKLSVGSNRLEAKYLRNLTLTTAMRVQCWLNLRCRVLHAPSPYQDCACLYSDNDITRRVTGFNFGQVTGYATFATCPLRLSRRICKNNLRSNMLNIHNYLSRESELHNICR
jgi:hypothetical protein